MTFEARYDGYCAQCGGDIAAGDEVCYQDDELMHDECRELD